MAATFKPYVFSEDSRAQADFYIRALGGEVQSVMTYEGTPGATEANKDKVMHMCILAGGVTIFMSDSFGPLTRGQDIAMSLEFAPGPEGQEAFDNLSAGGKVLHPLEPVFWGGKFGQFEDKFGVLWMITC